MARSPANPRPAGPGTSTTASAARCRTSAATGVRQIWHNFATVLGAGLRGDLMTCGEILRREGELKGRREGDLRGRLETI